MVDAHKDRLLHRDVVVVEAELFLDHFQDAVFQRGPSVFVFNKDEMILCALNVHDVVRWLAARLVAFDTREFCKLVNLLLCYDDGILVVQAREIYVLLSVVVCVHLVEDLPCYVELNPLAYHL